MILKLIQFAICHHYVSEDSSVKISLDRGRLVINIYLLNLQKPDQPIDWEQPEDRLDDES